MAANIVAAAVCPGGNHSNRLTARQTNQFVCKPPWNSEQHTSVLLGLTGTG